ncbi:Peptidoglycan-binding lysin domain protein [Geobacter metallireducens RCH3]|uniref:LysM domain protein n=1 Tax=Geobacter metallireducens (strain ATCC 53774 / DSM 7210 / GS-15) TaxID=269799 RepID=Q39QN6_GEOMG|nr:LysM peptidoglycan-binding domain-containing protein [Geobacter metallireducens]ABB33438.1 LysM domain protein [Geobacter metallireducens GS-15]EHP87491.1 Peptidoglycan-binding lysin domain protein [Geobacter metallireducens RCH3]
MTSRTYMSFCAAFTLWGLLGPLQAGTAQAASPSFELELKDLETTKPSPQHRRQPVRPPRKDSARKPDTKPDTPASEASGDYTRYTVRPGDFLFKILIRDFGLSNAQAEALIPEIQRINKLPSTTRLEVGQTILIPRHRRASSLAKAATPAPTPASTHGSASAPEGHRPLIIPPAPSSAPAPSTVVTSPPEPVASSQHETATETVASPPPPPPLTLSGHETVSPAPATEAKADLSFSTALIRLWENLVPGQRQIEPLTVNGKVLDPADYPLLLAADGGRILVDLRGTLQPQLRTQLAQKYPDIHIVTRGNDSLKTLVATLVRAAEFARAEENVAVDLGADPTLSVRADFRIVRLPTGRGGPETVLVFLDEHGPCLPPPLTDYLHRKGYQVAQFCDRPGDTVAEPGYDLRAIPPSTPCDVAVSLLNALSLKLDRNRIVSGAMGENSENRFSIRVEGYFEAGGKRFILDCSGNDPYNYTLFRLLQVQGYGIIQPQENDDFTDVTRRLLTELNYPNSFGRHEMDYGRYRIAITGFKITRRDTSAGRLLLTSRPSDPVFAELLRWAPAERK